MGVNWLDGLGDLNPQLFRELKGRWNWRNLVVASAAAMMPLLLIVLYHGNRLPNINLLEKFNRYCTGETDKYSYLATCLMNPTGDLLINWQLWWLDIFSALSQIGVFGFLVLGVYLIISDLEKEERLGTFNFLRLTPQSTNAILVGKLLGTPILLYWGALLWLPVHLGAGLAAQIPLLHLISFYGVTIVAALFYYDAALLYSLTTRWLGGFQPWLGSGALLVSLLFVSLRHPARTPLDWVHLMSPLNLLPYLVPSNLIKTQRILDSNVEAWLDWLTNLSWYNVSIGANGVLFASAMTVVFVISLWWIGRSLDRVFRNPTNTLLSKRQSYILVGCVEIALLGFSYFDTVSDWKGGPDWRTWVGELMVLNLLFFLGLIAAITPHRQTLQDWARYRHQFTANSQATAQPKPLIQALLWSEKSPAVFAMAINVVMAMLLTLGLLWWPTHSSPMQPHWVLSQGVVLGFGMILIYAVLAQLLLMLRTSKRGLWAMGTIASLIVLPTLLLGVLAISPEINPHLWLLTAFPWVVMEASLRWIVGLVMLAQVSVCTLFSLKLTSQLRSAGASTLKQLVAQPPAISPSRS